MIIRIKKKKSILEILSIVVITVFLVYAFATGGLINLLFGNYKNASVIIIISVMFLLLFYIFYQKKITLSLGLVLYPILSLIVLHGNANLKNNDIVNVSMTLGVFLLSMIILWVNNWEQPMLKIIVIISAFNAVASIVLSLAPSFYISKVVPLFADTTRSNLIHLQASGMWCGLTNSNSFNAIIMVNGIAVLAAGFIASKRIIGKSWFNILLVMLFVLVLIKTGKRGPLVFCGIGVFVAYFVYNSNRPATRLVKIVGIILLMIAGLVLVKSIMPQYFNAIDRLTDTDSIDKVRLALYDKAIKVFAQNPIFGIGWDAFRSNYTVLGNELNVHNIYIQLLCECGIVGALPFFVFFISIYVTSIKKLRESRLKGILSSDNELYLTFSIMYQTFFLLYGLTGNPLYDAPTLIVYILCCTLSSRIRIVSISTK